jgi:predicted heme/steroid binding protein
MQNFTRQELAAYDGKNGRPAYVAYNGKVYDVTESFLWEDGDHQSSHTAGADLSDEMGDAPHGPDMLDDFPVVGLLVD